MSRGRLTFNLQDAEQMKQFKKLIRRQYGGNQTDASGVEADEEHIASVRHLRPTPGETK